MKGSVMVRTMRFLLVVFFKLALSVVALAT
jgi:hypothetical protein